MKQSKHRLAHLLLPLLIASHASIAQQQPTNATVYKRRRPHSVNSNSITCKSIIAIGKTLLWTDDTSREVNRPDHTGEEFVCELYDGSDRPIQGTMEQIQELRNLLNNGTLISAVSTVEVYHEESAAITDSDGSNQEVVVLPPGSVRLEQEQDRTRQRLSYEGDKPVLVVRVIDKDGVAVEDNAATISDKIFGTNGDKTTMTSQYAACSFDKLQITWEADRAVRKEFSAPGVLEVDIGLSIKDSDQGSIRWAVYEAVGVKLGFDLPGPFEHVMFVLEGCYVDCGWAAYAYVNSWLSVYQGPFYKFPGVQMHEIGHNLNLAHSGGIGGETYTDHTCLMGNPLYSDTVVKMCYNPAKNFQMAQAGAWFRPDHIVSFDSGRRGGTNWAGRIIGAAEYDRNSANHPVVLKLVTGTSRDLFIGFNRAIGPNADNQQASDAVTITEAGNGNEYSQSYTKALLGSGHDKTFPNWRGSSHKLTVTVNQINLAVRPAYADITVIFGPQNQNPTRKPTPRPSNRSAPSDESFSPTLNLPTYSPTYFPTLGEGSFHTDNSDNLNKAVKGLMFTVKAKQDITIRAFDLYARRNMISDVTIYTKQGNYDAEEDRYGWDMIYQQSLQVSRAKTSLDGIEVQVAAGDIQAFFIYVHAGMMIKKTANDGRMTGQDDAIIIYSGTGFRREFHFIVGYGQYAGAIKYDIS